MSDWNSSQYLKFENQRTQPAVDLVNRIGLESPADIIDIGCGPGNSTETLHMKYPNARILGIDNSKNMIDAAGKKYKDLEFMLCDAENELTAIRRKFDIVFSNACIQWIPNHRLLLENMMALLKDGGVMAVQIPVNFNEPIHKIISCISANEKWSKKFAHPRIFYTLSQSDYFDILSGISSDFTMWQTTYFHKMESHEDIMEWYRGTGLRPYLDVLSSDDKTEFESDILSEVMKAYPKQSNGQIIFRFPRLFFIAAK